MNFTKKEKCSHIYKKWVLCSYFNRKLPPYEKPNNCSQYYNKYLKECSDKSIDEEKDKIFKASIFSTY